MKVKVYIDSAIAHKDDAYELLPVIIKKKDGTEIEDCNDIDLYNEILSCEDESMYSTNFYPVDKLTKMLNKSEPTIVFTNPKSLSKQYETYKKLEDTFPKLIIIQGSSFYNHTQRIIKAINEFDNIEEIKEEVIKMNDSLIFQALITNFDHLYKQGRINIKFSKLNKFFGAKAWIVFSNGEWKKHKIGRNVTKLTNAILSKIGDQPIIDIYASTNDNPLVKKIEKQAIEKFPYKKVEIKTFTTAMLINSGKDFIAIG